MRIERAYQDAIHDVAERYHVRYQTIGDLCRRRLGLKNIDEFVGLVTTWIGGNAQPLQDAIARQTDSRAQGLVRGYFSGEYAPLDRRSALDAPPQSGQAGATEIRPTGPAQEPSYESLLLRLPADWSRKLDLAYLADIGETREEVVFALLERGFESEKEAIRRVVKALGV